MWIRNQDKKALLDINNIRFTNYGASYDIEAFQNTLGWITLGVYSTKEKALKVMDMIQKYIGDKTNYYITQDIVISDGYHVLDDLNIPMDYCKNGVFEMPADEEVK